MDKIAAMLCYLLAILASVTAQQVICYSAPSCEGSNASALLNDCCSHGIDPVGLSYQIDERCMACHVVFGFNTTMLNGMEREENYTIEIGFISGTSPNLTTATVAISFGTAGLGDVRILGGHNVTISPNSYDRQEVTLAFLVDSVAQEGDETFNLTLTLNPSNTVPSSSPILINQLQGIIIDNDDVSFSFTENSYTMTESAGNIPVMVLKDRNKRLANPVMIRITPMIVKVALQRGIIKEFPNNTVSPIRAQAEDFNNSVHEMVFPADERDPLPTLIMRADIPIVNDDIDEADEQQFIVFLEIINATDLSRVDNSLRNITICKIIDDDFLQIGFLLSSYNFEEPSQRQLYTDVMLVKENNTTTEQTYSVTITVTSPCGFGIRGATLESINGSHYDFSLGEPEKSFAILDILPDEQNITFPFFLNHDEFPEGTETFRTSVEPNNGLPTYESPTILFANTLINIIDNDIVVVGFEQSEYSVNENDGHVEICILVKNPPPNEDLTTLIVTEYQTKAGSAGINDYTEIGPYVGLNHFAASVGSSTPRKFCFNITITNDSTIENDENFTVTLTKYPFTEFLSNIEVQPSMTTIVISDDDSNNADSSLPSNEGNDFVIGFFTNIGTTTYAVYICTKDPRGTMATISFPSLTLDNYPINIAISPDRCTLHTFPDGIAVNSPFDNDRAIRITTTDGNGADINVYGVNDAVFSADSFVALPCKTFNTNSYRTPDYKYFVFSTEILNAPDRYFSRVLMIPCSAGTHTITYTLPGGIPQTISNVPQYGTRIVQRETDITGTVVTSTSPLAVFTGHLCGQVPGKIPTCDHLIEQIPPHVVYGQTFFVVPMAVRESGDIIKVGSVTDDNQVNVTCTRLTASGTSTTIRTLPTSTINTGGVYEFRTEEKSGGESSADYKREFCCIETSKPAIVMQYSLGHNEDRVRLPPPSSLTSPGDPSMNLVPPVSQYKNDYLIPVLNEAINRPLLESFVGYAIAAEFFDPVNNDERNLVANGTTFLGHRNVLGSRDYINISCSNGRVCGYGAFGPIGKGTTRFAYTSQTESNPGLYAFVTSIGDQVQHAYPAGYECEPIGLPHISVFNITVSENAGTVIVPFQRTGGDLDVTSRIIINTAISADGRAMATTDFVPVTGTRLRWRRNEVQPLAGGQFSDAFRVQIVDDDVEESTEYFEVIFTIDSGAGYAFPNIVGRVTILDNDAPSTCDFNPTNYTVEEANHTFVDLIVETNNPDAVGTSCVFSTVDGTARAGSDYTAMSNVSIQFPPTGRAIIRVPIVNDDTVEMTERFIGSLTMTDPRVRIQRSMAQVDITDSDVVSIEFNPLMYTVSESDGNATLRIAKEGMIDRNVVVKFTTQDGTALSIEDYSATTQTLTFPSSENELFISIPIIDDSIVENDETFSAMLSLSTPAASVAIQQSTAEVTIINDDNMNSNSTTGQSTIRTQTMTDTTAAGMVPEVTIGVSVAVSLIALLVIITGIVLFIFCIIRKKDVQSKSISNDGDLPHSADLDDEKTDVECVKSFCESKLLIPGRHIQLGNIIGQGEFGIVYKAYLTGWKGRTTAEIVAVKTLKGFVSPQVTEDLVTESERMAWFQHENVMTLIGICTDFGENPCIVMPFMANGSLLAYLKKERSNLTVAEEDEKEMIEDARKKLLSMCLQVAKGMKYLASQKIVHRDLAARNCMIDDTLVIKVGDFGLSEDTYSNNYFRQVDGSSQKLPVKWMALESLLDRIFSEKTDVWSYGVTCWEIFTLGHTPYPALHPFEQLHFLRSGGRLEKPLNASCTNEMYDIMTQCWSESPEKRPSFKDLVQEIDSLLVAVAGYFEFSTLDCGTQAETKI